MTTHQRTVIASVLGGKVRNGAGDTLAQENKALLEVTGVAVAQQLLVPG